MIIGLGPGNVTNMIRFLMVNANRSALFHDLVNELAMKEDTDLCYNCGSTGHQIRECREATKCLNCSSLEHRTGSPDCKK